MSIPGIGKGFHWWHAATGISAAALLASIGRDWPNAAVIASGCCMIGLGEWACRPFVGSFGADNIRESRVLGRIITLAGFVVAAAGTWMALICWRTFCCILGLPLAERDNPVPLELDPDW
jgi:hypothetical protein